MSQTQLISYLDFILTTVSGKWTPNKRYAKLGQYLIAIEPRQITLYLEAGRETVERPEREPDFYDDGSWVYVDSAEKELHVTRCYPLFCMKTRYELAAEGSPREVYRWLAEREGWPTEDEELEAEVMPLSKAPPPDPTHLRLAVWAAALGRRTWTPTTTAVAIVVGGVDIGEEWVVRGRVVIDRSSGYRLRRYEYEVIDWDYLAQDKRRVYVIERGDIAYVLGKHKALKYDGAVKEIDISEVPIEALEKIAARRR